MSILSGRTGRWASAVVDTVLAGAAVVVLAFLAVPVAVFVVGRAGVRAVAHLVMRGPDDASRPAESPESPLGPRR